MFREIMPTELDLVEPDRQHLVDQLDRLVSERGSRPVDVAFLERMRTVNALFAVPGVEDIDISDCVHLMHVGPRFRPGSTAQRSAPLWTNGT